MPTRGPKVILARQPVVGTSDGVVKVGVGGGLATARETAGCVPGPDMTRETRPRIPPPADFQHTPIHRIGQNPPPRCLPRQLPDMIRRNRAVPRQLPRILSQTRECRPRNRDLQLDRDLRIPLRTTQQQIPQHIRPTLIQGPPISGTRPTRNAVPGTAIGVIRTAIATGTVPGSLTACRTSQPRQRIDPPVRGQRVLRRQHRPQRRQAILPRKHAYPPRPATHPPPPRRTLRIHLHHRPAHRIPKPRMTRPPTPRQHPALHCARLSVLQRLGDLPRPPSPAPDQSPHPTTPAPSPAAAASTSTPTAAHSTPPPETPPTPRRPHPPRTVNTPAHHPRAHTDPPAAPAAMPRTAPARAPSPHPTAPAPPPPPPSHPDSHPHPNPQSTPPTTPAIPMTDHPPHQAAHDSAHPTPTTRYHRRQPPPKLAEQTKEQNPKK
jgi:hypothetical protein